MTKHLLAGLWAGFSLAMAAAVPAAVTCTNENTAVAPTTDSADFTDNDDGTVNDTRTGLTWMRCSLGQSWSGADCTGTADSYTWLQALQVALDVNSGDSNADGDSQAGFAGQDGWRLPNKNELGSIVEERCWSPAINGALFPNTPPAGFWSSSPGASYSVDAWYVDFDDGGIYAYLKENTRHVRLVRGGQ